MSDCAYPLQVQRSGATHILVMSEPLTISLCFEPGPEEDSIPLVEHGVPVTPLFGDRFQLEGSSIFGGGNQGDIIEAELLSDGTYRFVRVLEPSGNLVRNFLLARSIVESAAFARLCSEVESVGGTWERMMGGVVYFHLPSYSSFDIDAELDTVISSVAEQSPPPEKPRFRWKFWRRPRA